MTGLAIACMVGAIVIEVMIVCCGLGRSVPLNYILLLAFTACESFMVAFICSFYTPESVLTAGGMTAGVTVALTAYACTTKTDFTMMGGLIWIICMAMLMLTFFSFFMTYVAWWHPVLSCILIIFYGIFLIYDTQLIVGGKKYALGVDDYIIGALVIYVDIIALFLELLKLFGDR